MAIRVNVTAVRDCPASEVRSVMSDVIRVDCGDQPCPPVGEQLQVTEHGGWTWFNTSVWGVSAGDLNRGLCRLARPALQFTTSDGDRWYLTVHGGPGGQVHFVHEFAYHRGDPDPADDEERMEYLRDFDSPPRVDRQLAFLEDDPDPRRKKTRSAIDYVASDLAQMGASLPDSLLEELDGQPYHKAMRRYRRWHADAVVDALKAAGIPLDSAAVREVLLWNGVGAQERGSDLGNLPRLLSVLGLGGDWDRFVAQAEGELPEDDEGVEDEGDDEPTPPPDLFGPVLALTDPLTMTAVAGGPVALPLAEVSLLRFFVESLAINAKAGVVLRVTLPARPKSRPLPKAPEFTSALVEVSADGFRVAFGEHAELEADEIQTVLGRHLSKRFLGLPDGATVDVAFGEAECPELNQRYRGEVAGGSWQISETHPPLTREALTAALALAREAAADPQKYRVRDEAEGRAVVELAARDPFLRPNPVLQKGKSVHCPMDFVGYLPRVIFRHRFAGHWDVARYDRRLQKLEEERAQRESQARRAAAEAERRREIPHDGEVLHRGKLGPYWKTDVARLTELDPEPRLEFDATLARLGFRHVVDLVGKKRRDVLLRIFTSSDDRTCALFLAKRTMYLGYEFFSRFGDGSHLTTTTNGATESQPRLQIYVKTCERLDVEALHAKHLWAIERFRTRKKTVPVALPTSPEGVAREYDRTLALREGVGQHFRIVATPPGEAPEWVRKAWVGLALPMFATTEDDRVGKKSKGVVSGKGTGKRPAGFTVRVTDAVDALEEHNPEAARWWRENTPQLLQPDKLFVFDGEVCELVDDEG